MNHDPENVYASHAKQDGRFEFSVSLRMQSIKQACFVLRYLYQLDSRLPIAKSQRSSQAVGTAAGAAAYLPIASICVPEGSEVMLLVEAPIYKLKEIIVTISTPV